jgi:CheY-like chemotaxis protein
MVHGFASRAGGCLRIESRVGIGTTVEIVLPRAAVSELGSSPAGGESADGIAADGSRPATILVVEDDEQVRQVIAGYLGERGYTIVEAPTAEAALVLSHSIETLDLLLTDVGMPGAAGPALVQRWRVERPDLRVLFITGQADFVADEPVLVKPFTGIQLVEAVQRRLDPAMNTDQEDGDKLLRRLRSPILCAAYLAWRAAHNGGRPPRLPDLGWGGGMPGSRHSFTVAVEPEGDQLAFRYLRVGSALEARLGRELTGTRTASARGGAHDDELLGSLEGSYRRCARMLGPSYEYGNYDFGDGEPVTFERIILPLSDDGQRVTHLLGMALFNGDL